LPRQGDQQPFGLRCDWPERLAVGFRIFVREVTGQRENVLGPFAQGGQPQIDHVEAVEQVFAKDAAFCRIGKVAVGGRDDADVDLDGFCAANPVDFTFLERAQKLCLQAGIHLADFVEQQCSPVGFLELADTARDGAGKRPLLMSEQFGFEQVLRDRSAVHRNERFLGAQRFPVYIAGEHFLTGTGFAGDQDGGVAWCHLIGQRDDDGHRFILVNQLMAFIGNRGENGCDQLGIWRQRQIFLGACTDRIDRAARVCSHSGGHDRRTDSFRRERPHQPADIERDIGENEVGAATVAQLCHGLVDVDRMGDFRPAIHGNFGRRADLALQSADYQ